MKLKRVWAMPNKNTFDIKPIGEFVQWYLRQSLVSVDPFARDKLWATYTNDLNPNTKAEYHLDALKFLDLLAKRRVMADLVIWDPPYSPRQIMECYDGIGKRMTKEDGQRTHSWKRERDIINKILTPNGRVLSFGWDSMGMGKKRGFEITRLLLVCHGAGHNDTICIAEKRVKQERMRFL